MEVVLHPLNGLGVTVGDYGGKANGVGWVELADGDNTIVLHSQTPESLSRLSDLLKAASLDLRQEIDAVERAERNRVADPAYVPRLDEALRHPKEFVDGMEEYGNPVG